MLIETNIEINLRSIEEFTRVMASELLEDKINFEILKENDLIKIKVKSEKLNKNAEFSYIDLGNKIEDQVLTMCKISLLKLLDKKYDWGSLMGVRPTKVLRRLLINGCDYKEARKILKDFYLVTDEKINLMETVVKKELELLDKEHINLYIGIPFCPTKCKYCSFASYEINGGVGRFYNDFVEALLKEIQIVGDFLKTYSKKVSSIYFGGGTPSTLIEEDLERVLKKLLENIDMTDVKEFTFEAGREDSLNNFEALLNAKQCIVKLSIS